MGELIAELVLRYGKERVTQWLAEKLAGSGQTVPQTPPGRCGCRDCSAAALGLQLDPDEGCYYWELPTREQ